MNYATIFAIFSHSSALKYVSDFCFFEKSQEVDSWEWKVIGVLIIVLNIYLNILNIKSAL